MRVSVVTDLIFLGLIGAALGFVWFGSYGEFWQWATTICLLAAVWVIRTAWEVR